jgi:TATA-binding protein-associated factor Taf7
LESEGFISSWNDARGFDMESYKASIEDDVVTEDCVCNEGSCVDDEEEDEDEEEQECCDNDSEYFGEEDEEEEDEDEDEEEEEDDLSEVENLSDRVLSLENDVNDIKHMVQQLFDNMVSSNQKKSLRKQMAEHY